MNSALYPPKPSDGHGIEGATEIAVAMSSPVSMLVYLGANAHRDLVHQLLELSPAIRFVSSSIFPEASPLLLEDREYIKSAVPFDSAIHLESGEIGFTPVNDYNLVSLIDAVMSDKHLSLLWTRFSNGTRLRNKSEVKRYEVVYSLIKSSLETCQAVKPDVVLFSYEPHVLPIYIFRKVVYALGIKTYTLTISPFIWRMFCEDANGNCSRSPRIENAVQKCANADDPVRRMIGEKQGNYSVAKPFYEKRNMRGGLVGRIRKMLVTNGWNPRRVLLNRIAFAEYMKESSGRDGLMGRNYICVFLQYQPEQTTLPEGGLFVHQMFAIQMLYSAVARLGISLVIREHPATFESVFDPKWRPRGFYKSIKRIGPNIHFDRIDADPFSLIENSVAVSSITGTVLLEALLRGKPAIAFGKHALKGLSAPWFVDKFADEVELRDMIVSATGISPKSIVDEIEKYLHQVYPITFGAGSYPGNTAMSLEKLRDARYTALRQVVERLARSCDVHE